MRERIVIVGAGSAMFLRGLISDLIARKWECDLVLMDIDPEALSVAEGLARKMIQLKNAPIRLSASADRPQAIAGATVVICTIGVGGRFAWQQDVFIPRNYGIYQPVGDTVMPGGASRALRMIPAMVDIAKDVMDLTPDALFFNYSNPMSAICRAVRKATGATLIGLCHGVQHVGKYLADIVDAKPTDVNYTAVGINHLTWFTEFRVKGKDIMPTLLGIAKEKLKVGSEQGICSWEFAGDKTGSTSTESFEDENPFSWQLMKLFGAFPAALDRHVIEFFPNLFSRRNAYYGRTPGIDAYSFESVIAYGENVYQEMKNDAFSSKPLDASYFDRISGEHEQVLDIIDSIRMDAGRIYSANLPNIGQVSNLSHNAIIESPAIADGGGIRAIVQEPLSSGIACTLSSRLEWVEMIVDAALSRCRDKFVQALVMDGAVDSIQTAERLSDDLLTAHAQYLPGFNEK